MIFPCLTWPSKLLCVLLCSMAMSHTPVTGWISSHSHFTLTLRCSGFLCTAVFRWGFLCRPLFFSHSPFAATKLRVAVQATTHRGRAKWQAASAIRASSSSVASSRWGRCLPAIVCRPCSGPLVHRHGCCASWLLTQGQGLQSGLDEVQQPLGWPWHGLRRWPRMWDVGVVSAERC